MSSSENSGHHESSGSASNDPLSSKHDAKRRKISHELPSVTKPQPTVQVIVGEEKAEFFVYKDFLCYYSPYFAAALRDGSFQEAVKQSVILEHADIEAFGLLVHWLYTQEIDVSPSTGKEAELSIRVAEDTPSWNVLTRFWVLADYLHIPTLQNTIMEVIIAKYDRLIQIPMLCSQYVYENTTSGCVLRKLWVDMCVHGIFNDPEVYRHHGVPQEMLLDLVVGFSEQCLTCEKCGKDLEVQNYLVKIPDNAAKP